MSDNDQSAPLARRSDGTFSPGTSGNAAGRPRSESAALRAKLAASADSVVAAVVAAAENGDVSAAKLILDRILPALRPAAQAVHLATPTDETALGYAREFLRAAAAGEIDPDVAGKLVTAAGTLANVLKIQELADRLAAIEKALTPQTTKAKSR